MRKAIAVASALVVLAVVAAVELPRATAATRVDFLTGTFSCQGDLIVGVNNMTATNTTWTVTFRLSNGSVKPPSIGTATNTTATQSSKFVTYDCSGGADVALQVRTTSTRVIPAVQFTPEAAGATAQVIAGGGWRVVVSR